MQLWVVWDSTKPTALEKYYGVVVTEIVERKLKKSCNLFIVTGRHRQKWQHLISVLEDFALDKWMHKHGTNSKKRMGKNYGTI